eukprot:CAMPEP_0116902204 /NCGR_PEP_ID=MMETSP0467-20121206/9868_1 /TAXON_ID=283647 /ORGANISM="Mesodinium pulex, Strain SPMC105" /LENGTH=100 /DNA_ID=CAMNT_0004575981 /DNA_START=271 /DNA_END=573 /DNA_ORIENTATION=+
MKESNSYKDMLKLVSSSISNLSSMSSTSNLNTESSSYKTSILNEEDLNMNKEVNIKFKGVSFRKPSRYKEIKEIESVVETVAKGPIKELRNKDDFDEDDD